MVLLQEDDTQTDENVEMEEEVEIEDNSEELEMQEPFNPTEIKIDTRNDTLRNIIDRLRNNEIDMNTEFQRHAELWDTKKMSRLIESILIRFPLPAFYFDASNDDQWLVVDGLQRLSSIQRFVIDQNLKLSGLEYLQELFHKNYTELSRKYQRRIDECPVTLFLIQPGTPKEVKFSLFRRINTGGLLLKDQEIRNAMTDPSVRDYLNELSSYEYLTSTIGNQSKRMKDKELILRFFAFYTMDFAGFKKNITSFLDAMNMRLEKLTKLELEEYREIFYRAIQRCYDLFGSDAFEKKTSTAGSCVKKNSSLFEVWTVAMAKVSQEQFDVLLANKDIVKEKHQKMIEEDNQYVNSITYSTQKISHFRYRHEAVNRLLQEVYDAGICTNPTI